MLEKIKAIIHEDTKCFVFLNGLDTNTMAKYVPRKTLLWVNDLTAGLIEPG